METLVNGNPGNGNGRGINGSEGYVKFVFSYISNEVNIKTTISNIDRNLSSHRLDLINFYYNMIGKFFKESNNVDQTTEELRYIKNYMSHLTENIGNYTTRSRTYLIPSLTLLTDPTFNSTLESLKKVMNGKNGNGIRGKYDNIKHKIKYCKSSLEFEVQRLESISKNARMLQNHLGKISGILNKYKTNTEKLEQFRYKLNKMKENKDIIMKYLSRTVQMFICNLYEIYRISNSLNSAKDKVSIATIKQYVDNINSTIKDINNILSIVKSHLDSLVGVRLGIDCGTVNEVECCIKEIVCGIHSKYCSLGSELSTVFSSTESSVPTLLENCKLPEIMQCTCTTQASSQNCAACHDCQGSQGCQNCEYLKQLLSSCSGPNIKQKVESINKVISQLIDGNPKDGCNSRSENVQQCTHTCQNNQQGRPSNTCQSASQGAKTSNTCQTSIGELIKSTLSEITKCQTSLVKCEGQQGFKCELTATQTTQTNTEEELHTSCFPDTTPSPLSCNELGKVKLCLDTIVNKYNCCQFEKMLNDGKVKCFDVFKWIFIYNFRELFCLYLSFDKSILDQISCIINKLVDIKSFITNKSIFESIIKCRIDGIKDEINKIPEQFKSLENTMKSGIKSSVVDMECAIEGVTRKFILCTLQPNIKNTILKFINYSSYDINNNND